MKTIQIGPVFYVYEHWRPDKDVCFYVGKGHGNRSNQVRRKNNRYHTRVLAKLSKMGMCVEVRMVQSCMTEADAFSLEIERIAFWRSAGVKLTNITDGGDGPAGRRHSELTKELIRQKRKLQKIVHSIETIEKLKAAHKAEVRVSKTLSIALGLRAES